MIGLETPFKGSSSHNYFNNKTPEGLSYSGVGTVVYPLNDLNPCSFHIAYNLQLSRRFVWSVGLGQQTSKAYMYTINKEYYYSNDQLFFSDSLRVEMNRSIFFTGIKGYFNIAPMNLYLFANIQGAHSPFKGERKTSVFTESVYHEHRTTFKGASLYWNYNFGIGSQRFISDNLTIDYGVKFNLGHYFFKKPTSDRSYFETGKLLAGEAPHFPTDNIMDIGRTIDLERRMFIYLNIGINKK